MRQWISLPVLVAALLATGCGDRGWKSSPIERRYDKHVHTLLTQRCVACHEGEDAEGGVDLSLLTIDEAARPEGVLERADRWERVAQVLALGVMPPEGEDPPTATERDRAVAWVHEAVTHAETTLPEVIGTTPLRRLNRAEYRATVLDLLGIDVDVQELLPPDDVGHGFDHLGEVLTVSPTHLEAYVRTAQHIAERVVVDIDPTRPMNRQFAADELRGSGRVRARGEGWYFSSHGTVSAEVHIPRGGRYRVTVRAWADQAGPDVARMQVGGNKGPIIDVAAKRGAAYDYEVVLPLEAGPRDIGATFVNDYYQPKAKDPRQRDRNLAVDGISIFGPLKDGLAPLPEATRQLFARAQERTPQGLRRIAAWLLPRAWRRPVSSEEIEQVMPIVERALAHGFGAGVQRLVAAALVSPHFLYRVEGVTPDGAETEAGTLTPHEHATRLSYFLWGTMPDETLRAHADEGTLDAAWDDEVTRMLAHERADALVDRFAFQWLGLLRLERATPDPKRFPTYTPALRRAMLEETRRFVGDVFRSGRDVRDLIDAPFTWLDDSLSRHYGLETAYAQAADRKDAPKWRRVSMPAERRGLLGQASVLTVTSYPTRTSPVQRGQYVLDTLLGRAPPPPPPGVGSLDEDETQAPQDQARTVRARLEIHRSDPACAACHTTMDALGFGLEPFDAIGRLRDNDLGHPIDATGTLPGGETFTGPAALRVILRRDPDVLRTFAERLLTYALGRGLTRRDGPALVKILQRAGPDGNTLEAFVRAVVASRAFQRRETPSHP